MKVKIIKLSKKDAFYNDRKDLIGITGEWKDFGINKNGWHGGDFIPDEIPNGFEELKSGICFAYVKFEVLEK